MKKLIRIITLAVILLTAGIVSFIMFYERGEERAYKKRYAILEVGQTWISTDPKISGIKPPYEKRIIEIEHKFVVFIANDKDTIAEFKYFFVAYSKLKK